MKKVAVTLVEGFEIVEAMAPVDMLKRAGVHVDVISVANTEFVKSAINIEIKVDKKLEEIDLESYDLVFLPGGPGTSNYYNFPEFLNTIKIMYEAKKYVTSICAAPSVFAKLNILKNRNAISFPTFQHFLIEGGATLVDQNVVVSDNVITGRAAFAAIDFGLKLVEVIEGEEKRKEVEKAIVYKK